MYLSAIAQTLRVVEHPDGVHQIYVFSAGGTYTPVSQEEAWIFEDLAAAYGLTLIFGPAPVTVVATRATATARVNVPTISRPVLAAVARAVGRINAPTITTGASTNATVAAVPARALVRVNAPIPEVRSTAVVARAAAVGRTGSATAMVAPLSVRATARTNAPTITTGGNLAYGLGLYGEGVYGA